MQKTAKNKAPTLQPQSSAAQPQNTQENGAVELSPSHLNLSRLAQIINQSPQLQAQKNLEEAIDNSPYMVAQRRRLDRLFGNSEPQKEKSESDAEESLQSAIDQEQLSSEQQHTEQEELQSNGPPRPLTEATTIHPNHTGLPDHLKAGIESLSGQAMDDVTVHYSSSKPTQLQAQAYTQGTDIYLNSGQEQHLAHEAWHVVQQKQGRVKASLMIKGIAINDDTELEQEADQMGERAMRLPSFTPASAVAPVTHSGSPPVVQGKFHLVKTDKDTPYKLYCDSESLNLYRIALIGPESILFVRLRDGFRVAVNTKTWEPLDADETYQQARLDKTKPWREFIKQKEDEKVSKGDDKSVAEKPFFIEPRQPGQKDSKKPSGFTARVIVAPTSEADEGNNYLSADELNIIEVRVSNERPPTRFEPYQKSHTVAWTLLRENLLSFQGEKLSVLLAFFKRHLNELVAENELEADAIKLAKQIVPDVSFLSTLEHARLPTESWIGITSELMRGYEIAYHKTAAASMSAGKAVNHGEQDAMLHLRIMEEELQQDSSIDPDDYYQKNFSVAPKKKLSARQGARKRKFGSISPSPLSDLDDLLDVSLASLEHTEYRHAVRLWYEMISHIFPNLLEQVSDKVANYYAESKLPAITAKDLNQKTFADLVGKFDKPDLSKRSFRSLRSSYKPRLNQADKTTFNAVVRLNPISMTPRHTSLGSPGFIIDELEIRTIRLGEERVDTRFAELKRQASHTVAWTLIRAAILGFSGQPFANLYAYLLHSLEEVAADLPPKKTSHNDALQAIDELHDLSDKRLSISDWHSVAARMVIEYVRLYNLTQSATFNKEERPKGHSEGYYMQILRENNEHLERTEKLFDTPEVVTLAAGALIDVELDHADLHWRSYVRALLHWQENLWNAFPALMDTAASFICTKHYATPLNTSHSNWLDLPALTPSGKAPATISDLVDCYFAEKNGWDPQAQEKLKVKIDAAEEDTPIHVRHTLGKSESLFNAFALGLIGLISEKMLDENVVYTKLEKYGITPDLFEKLMGLAKNGRNAAHARLVQIVLAPILRRITVATLREKPALVHDDLMPRCLAMIDKFLSSDEEENEEKEGKEEENKGNKKDKPQESNRDAVSDVNSPFYLGLKALSTGFIKAKEMSEEESSSAEKIQSDLKTWLEAEGFTQYLTYLAQANAWAGELELRALIQYFGVDAAIFADKAPDVSVKQISGMPNSDGDGEMLLEMESASSKNEKINEKISEEISIALPTSDDDQLVPNDDEKMLLEEEPASIINEDDLLVPKISSNDGGMELEDKSSSANDGGTPAESMISEDDSLILKDNEEMILENKPSALNGTTNLPPLIGLRLTAGHWAATTTQAGFFNLRDKRPVSSPPDYKVWKSKTPQKIANWLASKAPRGEANLVAGSVEISKKKHIVWHTTSDNNCSFNGFALGLMGLIVQGRLSAKEVGATLKLNNDQMDKLLEHAQKAQTNSHSARAIEHRLAGLLRILAVAELEKREDLLASMADEFIEELRGWIYTKYEVKWARASDLFADAGSSVKPLLEHLSAHASKELDKCCDQQNATAKEKAIDLYFEANKKAFRDLFLKEGVPLYCKDMKADQRWGGVLEMQALAKLFGFHLTTFKDIGSGLISKDEGVAEAGAAPKAAWSEKDVATLRNLDVIEGKNNDEMIYFKRLTGIQVAERFKHAATQDELELRDKFMAAHAKYCPYHNKAPVEMGMFRHQFPHWSAISTDKGAYDLNDASDRLDGRSIVTETVDSKNTKPRYQRESVPLASEDYSTAIFGGPIARKFEVSKKKHIVWRTTGDNNCSFNGFALGLMGLVAQGRLLAKEVGATLKLDELKMKNLLAHAQKAQTDRRAARAIELGLASPLRTLAVKELKKREDLLASMADEFVEELRGWIYTKYEVKWARASDLFADTDSSVKSLLEHLSQQASKELNKACDKQNATIKEKAIDLYFEANKKIFHNLFLKEGVPLYCKDMKADQRWGGVLELQALAKLFGFHLTTFKDIGGGLISKDEGVGEAGSMPKADWIDKDIATLRNLDVIEGKNSGDEMLYFKRLTGIQVAERFKKAATQAEVELRDKFMVAHKKYCPYHTQAPVEMGMFRHSSPHWSAVSTNQGAYDLNDANDWLAGHEMEKIPLKTPLSSAKTPKLSWQLEGLSETESEGESENKKKKIALKAPFKRDSLGIPGVTTIYADHMFGDKHGPFNLAKIDSTIPKGTTQVGLVNAANSSLLGGEGIDGAILEEEGKASRAKEIFDWQTHTLRKYLNAGEAMSAGSGALAAKGVTRIIHTVGPKAGDKQSDKLLKQCVRGILQEACDQKLAVIIFCNISSAHFGLNAKETASIIHKECAETLKKPPPEWKGWMLEKIIFNNFPGKTI